MNAGERASRDVLRLRCPRCTQSLRTPSNGDTSCGECGARFASAGGILSFAPVGAAKVRDFYEHVGAHAAEFARSAYLPATSAAQERQARIYARAVATALARWVPHGSTVLDVGCGHGRLRESALASYRMIGVDFVLPMLQSARACGYAVFHAEATALPFESDQFEYVLCTEVLNQYVDARALLAELARVCAPAGTVILSTTNRSSMLRAAWRHARSDAPSSLANVTHVMRTCAEVAAEARPLGLALRESAWLLSPSTVLAFSKSSRSAFAPFATNFFIAFEKRS